jgi:pyruvate/2-oxoglutarate dehydrogenase complex dihydrolipoamide acyltransferase (E2) component
MTVELTIPKTGMGIAEGTIQKWLKAEGEAIVKGEVLVEIETAKALEEVEAPISGVLKKIVVAEAESADVGTVIALLETA